MIAGVEALARAKSVAVLSRGAYYFLRETKHATRGGAARALACPWRSRRYCNPGTSPIASPTASSTWLCTLFRLTPEEALAGMTATAPRALGLDGEIATLEVGKARPTR
jgi:imidazolonepropionase